MSKFDSLSNNELFWLTSTIEYLDKWSSETIYNLKCSFNNPSLKNIVRNAHSSTKLFHSFISPFELYPLKNYISPDIYAALKKWRTEYVTSFADFMDYYAMLIVLQREIRVLKSELEEFT